MRVPNGETIGLALDCLRRPRGGCGGVSSTSRSAFLVAKIEKGDIEGQ